MKIETKVNISWGEIKQLIAEKYKINGDFDLYLEDELVITDEESSTVKHKVEQPWYPDDSGEWIEVPDNLMGMPRELSSVKRIEYLLKDEREANKWYSYEENPNELDFNENPHYGNRIVAYKIVGE